MKREIIRCPYCGAEYLPGEIFLPKHFLGQPKNVEKDFQGKILYNEGLEQDTIETYTCDYCKSIFEVKADIRYKVEEKINLKNAYVQKL